jgi:hypothetical protein
MKTALFTVLFTIIVCGAAALAGLHEQKAVKQKAFNAKMDALIFPATPVAPAAIAKEETQQEFNARMDKLLGYDAAPAATHKLSATDQKKVANSLREWSETP